MATEDEVKTARMELLVVGIKAVKVVPFPFHRTSLTGLRKRSEDPCSVIILPVVRVERDPGDVLSPRQRRAARAIMHRYQQAKRDAEAT